MLHTPGRRASSGRILYWFRSPPDVRVGREPLDQDAIKLIEQHHPDVQFDWPRLLKGDDEGRRSSHPTTAGGVQPAESSGRRKRRRGRPAGSAADAPPSASRADASGETAGRRDAQPLDHADTPSDD